MGREERPRGVDGGRGDGGNDGENDGERRVGEGGWRRKDYVNLGENVSP